MVHFSGANIERGRWIVAIIACLFWLQISTKKRFRSCLAKE